MNFIRKRDFMDIRQLRYFVAVIEEGTITAAARKLNISQPPLSTQMHLLEEELDVCLFERGARQIKLTDAGSMLYQYALEILELEDAAREELRNLRTGKKGILRIGLISSCDSEGLYRGLYCFRKEFPKIQFKIYEGNTYELLDYMEKGKIELAFVRTPFPQHDLEQVFLQTDRMAAVGQSHFFRQETGCELSVKDLAEVPLILYRRWEKMIRNCFEEQSLEPDILCINDDARTSLQWAAAGMGVALVPYSIRRLFPELVSKIIREDKLTSTLVLVKRRDVTLSGSAAALFRVFQEENA